jgi:hypothetical protein
MAITISGLLVENTNSLNGTHAKRPYQNLIDHYEKESHGKNGE